MKIYLNRIKLVLIILLSLLIVLSIILFMNLKNIAFAMSEETKTYSITSINNEFDNESVIVVMDEKTSNINKSYKNNYFGSMAQNIEDLTYIEGNVNDKKYLNKEDFHQILKIELSSNSKEEVIEVIHKIENLEGVLWAGPNYYYTPQSLPVAVTGSKYSNLWGMQGGFGIQAEQAWNITTGSNSVTVGIMDTGISKHPDLVANLVEGWDFYHDNSITDDDIEGHGTHVAGIIGAAGNNANGVVGVSPNVKLVPLQVTDGNHFWPFECIAKAITWAINHNIDIINCSGGGPEDDDGVRDALNNYKGLFVCCAGNDSKDIDNTKRYPADYSRGQEFSGRVITVGALTQWGNIPYFSNYGANTVTLFAPGRDILSSFPASLCSQGTGVCEAGGSSHYADGYHYSSGTSMATPFVTGVAALLLSKDNTLTASELKQIIFDSVDKDSQLSGKCVTGGRLNAYNAVNRNSYKLKLVETDTRTVVEDINNGDEISIETVPARADYEFEGYYTGRNGTGTKYIGTKIVNSDGYYYLRIKNLGKHWYGSKDLTLYANWTPMEMTYTYNVCQPGDGGQPFTTGSMNIKSGKSKELTAPPITGYTFSRWVINDVIYYAGDNITLTLYRSPVTGQFTIYHKRGGAPSDNDGYMQAVYTKDAKDDGKCLAEGTLITLADGSQKPVELLTGSEQLLVWNLNTGSFDCAPILFIDNDAAQLYEVINLYFSDGTCVEVISEHAFWDINLNKYVTLSYDAEQYVGHWFNKQTTNTGGALEWTSVQLINVEIQEEYTSAWSPVTYGHLCYYVNGMLSMPGGIEGLYNIFEVDAELMKYDMAAYEADIATYGLFTYEEFCELYDIPELMFDACGGQYLKVAIGKGLLDYSTLSGLVERYGAFFEV